MSEEEEPKRSLSITEAAAVGDLVSVRRIINEGGNVDEVDAKGSSALLHAAWKCYNYIIQLLLTSKVNAELRDALGLSALHVSCLKGNIKAVQLLLNHGCDPNGALHPRTPPPMTFAIKGHEDIIPLLINCGADVLNQNGIGDVPLVKVLSNGQADLVRVMLSKGKPDLSFVNKDGDNIFQCLFKSYTSRSASKNHCELLDLLLDYAQQTETQLAKAKRALTIAMPCLIRHGCMMCFKTALPIIDITCKYNNKSENMQK